MNKNIPAAAEFFKLRQRNFFIRVHYLLWRYNCQNKNYRVLLQLLRFWQADL